MGGEYIIRTSGLKSGGKGSSIASYGDDTAVPASVPCHRNPQHPCAFLGLGFHDLETASVSLQPPNQGTRSSEIIDYIPNVK